MSELHCTNNGLTVTRSCQTHENWCCVSHFCLWHIILLNYLIFMCTSTQQWQLRFYLWPCLFFFTSLVFETFTILFPHETCIENIRTRRGEELKMLKTANTVSMFSSAFCMPGRRGSCCSLTVTSSLPTRAITQGLQTLEMCCARSIDSPVSCTQDTH